MRKIKGITRKHQKYDSTSRVRIILEELDKMIEYSKKITREVKQENLEDDE